MHSLFSRADRLTDGILAAAIEVHRDQGSGLIESIHEQRLQQEFELRALKVVNQKLVSSTDTGFMRDEPLQFDELAKDRVTIEPECAEWIQMGCPV